MNAGYISTLILACVLFLDAGLSTVQEKPCRSGRYENRRAIPAKCIKRDYGNGSPVCVCNADSCDFVEPVEPIGDKGAVLYTSDKSGRRLERSAVEKRYNVKNAQSIATFIVDTSIEHQTIEGFGGAFTDATGINLASLPQSAQDALLRSYFSKDGGIEYTLGRVPISSCDFSARKYSYDDAPNDFQLEHFSLVEEDFKYKIPYMHAAQNFSTRPIRFLGSSWSAPAWMKTSGKMESNGTLLGEPITTDQYYNTWANYYVKFLQEYEKHGISFWSLTGQNEPTTGYLYNYSWQTQGFTPELQRDFIKYNLGPALKKTGFGNVSIMILDDQRFMLPSWARRVLLDEDAAQYVSHIAVHFYWDQFTPTAVLDATHQQFPQFPMIGTEACVGTVGGPEEHEPHVLLGSWERAEKYAHDIIEDLNHWFVGWIDWNLALDLEGGPNWANNFVDSPIIVNATAGEFYKQPMFYALGHFSKFLPPGSYRTGVTSKADPSKLEMTSFLNSDGYRTIVLMNKASSEEVVSITETGKDQLINVALPARSIVTVLWK